MEYGLELLTKTQSKDCLVIFVHGLNSDNQAWRNEAKNCYWPDFLGTYQQCDLEVGLFSYPTSLKSRDFSIPDAARNLHNSMKTARCFHFKSIVFVGHSMGGVIVRDMLIQFEDYFKDIQLGLLLVASPSLGSKYATAAKPLSFLFKQKQLGSLTKGNAELLELNSKFRNFQQRRRDADQALIGKELIEDVSPVKGSIFLPRVVEREAAGLFFGEELKLPRTDHSSIAQPTSVNSSQHQNLILILDETLKKNSASNSDVFEETTPISNDKGEIPEKYRITFNNELEVDKVSLNFSLKKYSRHSNSTFEIEWHELLIELKEVLETLISEAEKYKDKGSVFYGFKDTDVTEFYNEADAGLKIANAVFLNTHKRIPLLLNGMYEYCGEYISDLQVDAVDHYLRLGCAKILEHLISPLRLTHYYEKPKSIYNYFPKKYEHWFEEALGRRNVIFASIFKLSEPIYQIYLTRLGNHKFLYPQNFFGPMSLIQSCDWSKQKLHYELVEKYIIPQNEFIHLEDTEEFFYDTNGSYTKRRDESGVEI